MFYTAIIMGLAGSLHCAGMCSPLAMAMTRNKPFLLSSLLYNSGRIFIYAALGAMAATFGSILHLGAYQQSLSLILGAVFIFAGLSIGKMRIPYFNKGITSFAAYLKRGFARVSVRKSGYTTFILGMLNGMLPCGLTYLALSACLILPATTDGLLYMLLFGLGTWPVMIGSTKILSLWKNNLMLSYSKLSKFALILVGCTLLLRVWWVHPHADALANGSQVVNSCK